MIVSYARPNLCGSPPSTPGQDEPWDFTPAHYLRLRASGKALRIARSSAWVPTQLRRNLLNTLAFLLNPSRKPSGTEGVNALDLYHGHLGLPKGKVPRALADKLERFDKKWREACTKAFGSYQDFLDFAVSPDMPWRCYESHLPAFKKVIRGLLPFASEIIKDAVKVKGVVAFYHSYEVKPPSDLKHGEKLLAGDPRRNYRTPLHTSKPAAYKPPNIRTAASTWREYDDMLRFYFLVDQRGRAHVTLGSLPGLDTIMAR